ncbi:MAG: glycosyltransferase [Planctomycetota bacterium]|nr:MAG: glycosyltransferase [Planctomycetota bacterium]
MSRAASVIVVTYNSPQWLALICCALLRQRQAPQEILIADDGSSAETAQMIEGIAAHSAIPLRHIWHPDRGFRKGAIINRAAALATADNLLFLDGDTIPHRDWVADHLHAADGRSVWCGRRVRLGPEITASITDQEILGGQLDSAFSTLLWQGRKQKTVRNWGNAPRYPWWLCQLLYRFKNKGLMGCNFSLPRTVFAAINGYNEDFIRREDWNLEIRLRQYGAPLRAMLNHGIAFHLHHNEFDYAGFAYPDHGPTWTVNGLDRHDDEVVVRDFSASSED